MRRSYFFVRHGRAVYQEKDFRRDAHPPGTDWPLSGRGRLQARAVASPVLRFGVERVLSSGLARARETAKTIAGEGALPYDHQWSALDEIHPLSLRVGGAPPGEKWPVMDAWRAARAVRRFAITGKPERGYTLRVLDDRVRGVLRRLDALDEARVAVVGHGYWIYLASLLVGGDVRFRWIDNCSVTRIDANGEGVYRLVNFAQVMHEL